MKTRDRDLPHRGLADRNQRINSPVNRRFDTRILFPVLGLQGILLLLTPLMVVVLVIFHHDTDYPAPPR